MPRFLSRSEHAQCSQRVAIFAVKQNLNRRRSVLGAKMPVRRLKRKTKSSTARQNIGSREEGERGGKETTDESLEQTKTAKEESQGETNPDTSSITAPLSSSGDEQEQSDSKEPKVMLRKLRPRKPNDIPLSKYGGIVTRSRAKTTPTSPGSDQDPFTLDTAPPPQKKAREDVPAPGSSGELAKFQVGKEAVGLRRKRKDQDVGVATEGKPVDDTGITGGEEGGEGTEEEGIDVRAGDGGGGGGDSVERPRKFWLMKSEPESRMVKGVDVKFGIEELANEEHQTACWDGVRNYQARNFLRDEMKIGDLAFFYHSSCKTPGIAGIIEVVRDGYVDHTQFDKSDPHYDAGSHHDSPRWYMVDVRLVRRTKRFLPLSELKAVNSENSSPGGEGPLSAMPLLSRSRLSVQPVSEQEFDFILSLEDVTVP